jgi:hypothetical protein
MKHIKKKWVVIYEDTIYLASALEGLGKQGGL